MTASISPRIATILVIVFQLTGGPLRARHCCGCSIGIFRRAAPADLFGLIEEPVAGIDDTRAGGLGQVCPTTTRGLPQEMVQDHVSIRGLERFGRCHHHPWEQWSPPCSSSVGSASSTEPGLPETWSPSVPVSMSWVGRVKGLVVRHRNLVRKRQSPRGWPSCSRFVRAAPRQQTPPECSSRIVPGILKAAVHVLLR